MTPADRIRESERSGGELMRPKFRPELVLRPDGDQSYFVLDSHTGREFKLGEWEHRIVQLLDGTRRPDDVCRDLAELHGVRCARPVVHRFIGQLSGAGLLDDGAVIHAPPPRVERRGPLYMVRLAHPDELARRITAQLRYLGHPLAALAAAGLIASAAAVTAAHLTEMGAQLANAWTARGIAITLCLTVVSGLVHESAHALAASWFGARVVSAGVGTYYFRPCLFCEVRGVETIAPWKRLIVSGAGVTIDALQASVCVIASRLLPAGTAADALLLTGFLLGVRVLLNLNPLLKLDGYYVLVDLTGQRDLREKAFRTLATRLRDLGGGLRRGSHRVVSRREVGCMLYGLLAIAYLGGTIAVMAVAFERWLRTTLEGADLIIATLIVLAVARLTDSTLQRRARAAQTSGPAAARRG